jgi:predicted phage terminase large subunit-like protein
VELIRQILYILKARRTTRHTLRVTLAAYILNSKIISEVIIMKVITPNPGPQEQFLGSPADITIFGGAAGGGKSYALLMECLRYIDNSEFGAIIFRRTSKQVLAEGGLWYVSQQLYRSVGGVPKETTLEWQFPSGARVGFACLDHENDKHNFDGAQIALICFDELTHYSSSQFFYMLSRNRSTCGVKPYILATTNPDASSWVKDFIQWWIDEESGYPIPERSGVIRWFYNIENTLYWYDSKQQAMQAQPEMAKLAEPKSVTFIPSKLEDNPMLLQKDSGYRANLMALSLVEKERLYCGNWNIIEAGGNMFNQNWWKLVDKPPEEQCIIVRYWDKAATANGGCETAGVRMSKTDDGFYYIEHVVHGQWSTHEREQIIRRTAEQDGTDVEIYLEQEPGSAGKDSAQYTIKNLAGFKVEAERSTGNKIERAKPFSSQVEAGIVYLVKGEWNKVFIHQHHNFPQSKLNDMVDAASGAFNILALREQQSESSDWASMTSVCMHPEEDSWNLFSWQW